jgi:hypothetical protein
MKIMKIEFSDWIPIEITQMEFHLHQVTEETYHHIHTIIHQNLAQDEVRIPHILEAEKLISHTPNHQEQTKPLHERPKAQVKKNLNKPHPKNPHKTQTQTQHTQIPKQLHQQVECESNESHSNQKQKPHLE